MICGFPTPSNTLGDLHKTTSMDLHFLSQYSTSSHSVFFSTCLCFLFGLLFYLSLFLIRPSFLFVSVFLFGFLFYLSLFPIWPSFLLVSVSYSAYFSISLCFLFCLLFYLSLFLILFYFFLFRVQPSFLLVYVSYSAFKG